MKIFEENLQCPLCGGRLVPGSTTFSAELGFGIVVVRNVPARVCDQCGEDWIEPAVAQELEQMVAEANDTRKQVNVLSMA